MRFFLAVVEDLLLMKHVMKSYQEKDNEFIDAAKKDGLKYEGLKIILKNISKNRKSEYSLYRQYGNIH